MGKAQGALSVWVEALVFVLVAACSSSDDTTGAGQLTGTLYVQAYDHDVHAIDLAAGTDTTLGSCDMPTRTTTGSFLGVVDDNLAEVPASFQGYRHIVDNNGDIHSDFSAGIQFPRQSPDGTKVAFATTAFGYILVVDFQTGAELAAIKDPSRLGGFQRPSWTPDGRLVFADGYDDGLFISDAAFSNNVTRIAPNVTGTRYPIVSHDGKSIAYLHDKHIWKMGIDGANPTQLELADTTGETGDGKLPFWSPDDAYVYWPGDAGDVSIHSSTSGAGPTFSLYATAPATKNDTILLGFQGMDWVR